uniref:XisI protein n=1 Tax=Candidatus Kentrum sp. MB TaxID=2138164 RepID=A0A451BBX8_9GAMM|nr:MAG: XisI protein [Candidatus Kentron sp. MB]VFK75793.1 MAG: XisI protein [Candidatus Kentron sp. MB]
MDTIEHDSRLIQDIINEYARNSYAHGDIQTQTVFDTLGNHYLLMLVGREGPRRVHGCLIHIDIINGKIWVQRDGTEEGIVTELLNAGIPKDRIVLGFRSPDMRRYTEYAVA